MLIPMRRPHGNTEQYVHPRTYHIATMQRTANYVSIIKNKIFIIHPSLTRLIVMGRGSIPGRGCRQVSGHGGNSTGAWKGSASAQEAQSSQWRIAEKLVVLHHQTRASCSCSCLYICCPLQSVWSANLYVKIEKEKKEMILSRRISSLHCS